MRELHRERGERERERSVPVHTHTRVGVARDVKRRPCVPCVFGRVGGARGDRHVKNYVQISYKQQATR